MPKTEAEKIDEFFADSDRMTQAMGHAVQQALRVHKALGQPIVAWRDGKVVQIPAEQIELEPAKNGATKLPDSMIP